MIEGVDVIESEDVPEGVMVFVGPGVIDSCPLDAEPCVEADLAPDPVEEAGEATDDDWFVEPRLEDSFLAPEPEAAEPDLMQLGRDLHQKGVKADAGKLPIELVPFEAIEAIAEILDFGRQKYTENGWQTVPEAYRRYFAAALRHLGAMQQGERDDPESGKPHVYHALCNLAFLAYFNKRGIACRVFDDLRPIE